MQDLTSQVYPDGPMAALVPTSQGGGNDTTVLSGAMTAPGTPSQQVDPADVDQPPYGSVTANVPRRTVTDKTGRK